MLITYLAMSTAQANAFQAGALDANGLPAERHVSDGDGILCRHCLQNVATGEDYLILAFRPFPTLQPYAEAGPIFLHASQCQRAEDAHSAPSQLAKRESHLIKGYSREDRIVYGTGAIVASIELDDAAARILERDDVTYVHVRSSLNNCYTCRIERA